MIETIITAAVAALVVIAVLAIIKMHDWEGL